MAITQPAAGLVSMRRLEALLGRDRDDLRRIASAAGRYYRPFDYRPEAGRGRWRHIDNPQGELRSLQDRIRRLLAAVELPPTIVGGVRGRSIRDHARPHPAQPVVVTLDLRDCFPRTDYRRVFAVYREVLGCSTEIASLLTKLTTLRRGLPQGAPTSTPLAILSLLPMHQEVRRVAAGYGVEATFYIDDIALSGARTFDAMEPVIRVIHTHGHAVRQQKIRRMPADSPQQITGIMVNRKMSAGRTRNQRIVSRLFARPPGSDAPDHEIRTTRGQIAHVEFLCPSQALRLQRLADQCLPEFGLAMARPRRGETRPCSDPSRHRRGSSW